ncbi:MAG: hypothetical protein EZS28_055155, partial [Streblomastix strix]
MQIDKEEEISSDDDKED